MRIQYFIFSFLFILTTTLVEANNKLDSLKRELLIAQDTKKVDIQLALSEIYRALDPAEAIHYAQEAYENAIKIEYQLGIIRSINYQGVSYEYAGKYDQAISKYREGLVLSKENQNRLGELESYGNIAIVSELLGKHDSAIDYHQKALSLAYEINNKMEIGDNLANLGLLYEVQGDYENALIYLRSALSIYEELNDLDGVAGVYNDIGHTYAKRGHFPTALGYHLKALKIAQKDKNEHIMAATYSHIGKLHLSQKDWHKALRYYRDALALRQKNGEKTTYSASYKNIASVLIEMGKYEEAIGNLNKGQQFSRVYGNKYHEADILFYMGVCNQRQKNYRAALNNFSKAYELKQLIKDPYGLVKVHTHLGEVYTMLNQNKQAIDELKQALELAEKIDAKELMRDVVQGLSDIHVKQNNYQKAFAYQKEVMELNLQLFNKEKTEAIAEKEAHWQVEQNNQQMEMFKKDQEAKDKELEQQRWLFITLGAVLLLTFALLLVVLRSNRQNQLAKDALALQKAEIEQQNEEILTQQQVIEAKNNLLETRYEELKELDTEKNYLIGVVAHDLQSPLNQIKGFLTILKYEKDKLPESAIQTHGMISQTVKNMSEMIRKILDLKAIESKALNIKLETYQLNDQLSEIVDAFQVVASKKSIQLKILESDTQSLVSLDKNFAEQIFENLISNAIKFSPPQKEIWVSLENLGEKVHVHVKDQGPGIAEEEQGMLFKKFQKLSAKPTGKESSTGLGLSIVKKYVEAMDGLVWCESKEGEGADFIVEFNLASQTSTPSPKETA